MNRRGTVQKALIMNAVRELSCHAAADEIYEYISSKHPNISKGTVYRNLNLLSETGEIKKVEIPNGADRYDHRCHNHYHARCSHCGRVFDADIGYIAELDRCFRDTNGFTVESHDIVFKGTCNECGANSNTNYEGSITVWQN